MFKLNSLCKTGKVVVFFVVFWCKQDQKGPGGADIHIYYIDLEKRVRRSTLRGVPRMCGVDGGTDCIGF